MGLLRGPQPKPEPEPEKKPEQEDAEQKLKDKGLDERERVGLNRLLNLMDAGYPFEIAQQIARRFDIDWHQADDLLKEGCTPQNAARILL